VKGIVAQYASTDLRRHSFAANKLPNTIRALALPKPRQLKRDDIDKKKKE
jgi:hypothetical protein